MGSFTDTFNVSISKYTACHVFMTPKHEDIPAHRNDLLKKSPKSYEISVFML